jgi:hypothetical protein
MKPGRRHLLVFGATFAGIAIGLARQMARTGHLGGADLIAAIFIIFVIVVADIFYKRRDKKDQI